MANAINFSEDFINVDDITARFAELRDERDENVLGAPDGTETPNPKGWRHYNPDEAEELDTLEAIVGELSGMSGDHRFEGDWFPQTLIAETGFVEYTEELCKDIGDVPADLPGYLAIDWEKTAENIKVDYSEIEIEGKTFLYR